MGKNGQECNRCRNGSAWNGYFQLGGGCQHICGWRIQNLLQYLNCHNGHMSVVQATVTQITNNKLNLSLFNLCNRVRHSWAMCQARLAASLHRKWLAVNHWSSARLRRRIQMCGKFRLRFISSMSHEITENCIDYFTVCIEFRLYGKRIFCRKNFSNEVSRANEDLFPKPEKNQRIDLSSIEENYMQPNEK